MCELCQGSGKKFRKVNFVLIYVAILDIFLQAFLRSKNIGVPNRGVSFGLAPGIGLIISEVTYGIFIVWYLLIRWSKKRDYLYLLLLCLGGGVNIVCRLIWGSVWDYICIPFLPFCFNLSDVLISLGVVSYILGINGNRCSLRRQGNSDNK